MSLKRNNKKDSKKVFQFGLAALTSCLVLSGCGMIKDSIDSITGEKKDDSLKTVVYCKPSTYKVGKDTIELVLAKDGKTIEQYTAKQSVNKDFIANATKYRNKHGAETTEEEVYQSYLDNFRAQYNDWTKSNKKVPWMATVLSETPEKHEASLSITFDFTSKNYFPNQETLDFLYGFMPTEYFYDEDEQKMVYKEDVIAGIYEENDMDIRCETNTQEYSETLHSKIIVQTKQAAKKDKDKN